MRFVTSGKTRVVVLIGPYALKIARFGVTYTVHRAIEILRSGQTRDKIVEWHDRNLSILDILCETFFIGIVSNRKEYRRSRNHSDLGLMPTLWTFCYLLNVQRRGHPVANGTRLNHPLLRLIPRSGQLRSDIDRPEQYCWQGRQLLLVDYAHPDLEGLLGRRRLKPAS